MATAIKTPNASGLFSDSIWEPSLAAADPAVSASNANITTTGAFTTTFTAPNTTGKTTGVWFWPATISRDITVTLQEATVDTACTVQIPQASIKTGSWNYVRFPTPYQWTATTAGRYRFKFAGVGGMAGAISIAGGTVVYVDTYDSPTTCGAGDDAWIGGHLDAGGLTQIDIETRGTSNVCGAGGNRRATTGTTNGRIGSIGLNIGNGGRIWCDPTLGDNYLQVKGDVIQQTGGIYDRPGHPTDLVGQTTKLIIDCAVDIGDYYIASQDGSLFNMKGGESTTPYAEYVSGTGTSGSHFTVDRATDWVVGMEIVIGGEYNHIEKRFIKTVYSSTEFQLSTTAGGAEAALTYTHPAGISVSMITRNSIIEHTDSTRGSYFYNVSTDSANCDIRWVRYNDMSYNYGVGGFYIRPYGGAINYDGKASYMVFHGGNANRNGYTSVTNSPNGYVDEGIVWYLPPSSTAGSGAITIGSSSLRSTNQTYRDFVMYGGASQCLILSSAFNNTFEDFKFIGCNTSNNVVGHSLYLINSGSNLFTNLRIDGSRGRAIYANGGSNNIFNDARFGSLIANDVEVYCVSDTLNEMVFNSGTFTASTLVSNHTAMLEGSRIGFHRYQDTDRNHRAYQPNAEIYSSGTGLTYTIADTTFDANSLSMRNAPLNASNYGTFNWYMPQRAGNTIVFLGKLYFTSDFDGDALVNLYLDGSDTPDDSYTLSGSHSTWIPFVLSADYTSGIYDRNARIELKVRGTAGAVHADTFFNSSQATNPIGSLDLWQDGVPNTYLVSTVASASEISNVVWSDSNTYSAGSKGNILASEILSNTDATQAKVDGL